MPSDSMSLIVMDLCRLSRSQSDLPKTIDRLTHRGVRVIGVQDGYDSSRKGHKLQAGCPASWAKPFERWWRKEPTQHCNLVPCAAIGLVGGPMAIARARPRRSGKYSTGTPDGRSARVDCADTERKGYPLPRCVMEPDTAPPRWVAPVCHLWRLKEGHRHSEQSRPTSGG